MKFLLFTTALLFSISGFAETKKECKKKGLEFDRKAKTCKETFTKKRKSCESDQGTWQESSGKCSGVVKLKGKEKKALKLVEEAAQNDSAGSKLTKKELQAMAVDLATYAKKNKVKLTTIKISFKDTGLLSNTSGEQLKSNIVKEYNGFKLYHIEEGSTTIESDVVIGGEVEVERAEADIEIPTNFFPPNLHEYTEDGKAELLAAIINGADEGFHVFNITIVESSASRLANTGGDFQFSPGDTNEQKQQKLLGLALARSNSTEATLKREFPELLIVNKKNAVVSGSADCYGSGDTSGPAASANVISACKSTSKKAVVSDHYNKFQYVKLHVEYMKDTSVIRYILEKELSEEPNSQGILAKFEHSKKYKSKIKKKPSIKKFKKHKFKTKKFKAKKSKSKKKKFKTLGCPKW